MVQRGSVPCRLSVVAKTHRSVRELPATRRLVAAAQRPCQQRPYRGLLAQNVDRIPFTSASNSNRYLGNRRDCMRSTTGPGGSKGWHLGDRSHAVGPAV